MTPEPTLRLGRRLVGKQVDVRRLPPTCAAAPDLEQVVTLAGVRMMASLEDPKPRMRLGPTVSKAPGNRRIEPLVVHQKPLQVLLTCSPVAHGPRFHDPETTLQPRFDPTVQGASVRECSRMSPVVARQIVAQDTTATAS